MTTLPLKTSEGHFVITLEGKNFVIDTGSPISFSCDYTVSHIDIGESHFGLTPFNSRKMAMELENLVKMPVSGIIGMDTLKELKRMEISKEEGYIKFGGDISTKDDEHVIPFAEEHGILTIGMKVNGRNTKAILDTGARIDYMNPALLDTSIIVSHESDYNPNLGHFEVDGYNTHYTFGDMEVDTICYEETYELKIYIEEIGLTDVSGIIGLNGFLERSKKVKLCFDTGHVYLSLF